MSDDQLRTSIKQALGKAASAKRVEALLEIVESFVDSCTYPEGAFWATTGREAPVEREDIGGGFEVQRNGVGTIIAVRVPAHAEIT